MTAVVDEVRANLVVCDEHGLHHASVLCNALDEVISMGAVAIRSPRVTDDGPFAVALCDFFACVDDVVTRYAHRMEYPTRRWRADQEAPGVVSCLACLGS